MKDGQKRSRHLYTAKNKIEGNAKRQEKSESSLIQKAKKLRVPSLCSYTSSLYWVWVGKKKGRFPWQTSRIVDEIVFSFSLLILFLFLSLSFGMCIYGAEHVINPRPSSVLRSLFIFFFFYNLDPDGRREPLYSIRVVATTADFFLRPFFIILHWFVFSSKLRTGTELMGGTAVAIGGVNINSNRVRTRRLLPMPNSLFLSEGYIKRIDYRLSLSPLIYHNNAKAQWFIALNLGSQASSSSSECSSPKRINKNESQYVYTKVLVYL